MTKVSQIDLINGAKLGKVVSFPTDTVPALAVKPEASELIFKLKQRSQDKPLILMAATFEEFLPYLKGTTKEIETWQEIATQYWPGALTLVLPASAKIPQAMNPNNPDSIGVRIPNLKVALDILSKTKPLATTSANLSGQPPLEIMAEIDQAFPEVLTLNDKNFKTIIGSGRPSTVAKWSEDGWQILRQGSVILS